jgi:gluconate 5-dehydrogenase
MQDLFSLENKNVVIFGAAGYIGRHVTCAVLQYGGHVIAADQNHSGFDTDEMKDVRSHKNYQFFECDVHDSTQIRAAYDECEKIYGNINAMVNLVAYGKFASIDKQTDDDMIHAFDGVAGQAFRTIREIIPYFQNCEGGA